jgi:hypothetical protein
LYRYTPVAFDSTMAQPGKATMCRREHRLVVAPDFQGLGLGSAVGLYKLNPVDPSLVESAWFQPLEPVK